jgi:hypothetical protein
MNNYILMIVAFILGQLAYASVSIYIIQNKVTGINYWQAVGQYCKKEVGSLVMAACGWAIIMFIASDWIDVNITRKDLLTKETLTLKEKMIVYQRTFAVLLGGVIQHVLYVAFKKGKKAIHDYAQKNNVDDNTQP